MISGANSLTYAGTGTLTLNTANTFSGGLTINAGATVALGNATARGHGDDRHHRQWRLDLQRFRHLCEQDHHHRHNRCNVNVGLGTGNTLLTGDLTGFSGRINCNGGQT